MSERTLTENQRRVALIVASESDPRQRKWLNLVLDAYDALEARLREVEAENERLARELAEREGWTGYHERVIRERDEARERLAQAEDALRAYHEWASRMPDAGFNEKSPRWMWWLERPKVQADHYFAAVSASPPSGSGAMSKDEEGE